GMTSFLLQEHHAILHCSRLRREQLFENDVCRESRIAPEAPGTIAQFCDKKYTHHHIGNKSIVQAPCLKGSTANRIRRRYPIEQKKYYPDQRDAATVNNFLRREIHDQHPGEYFDSGWWVYKAITE